MSTNADRRQEIVESLRDKDYRDLYVAEHIRQGIAFQIRMMREDRGWTQSDLGERMGMAQETISQLEDPDYGRLTLRTLKRLGSAFDVAPIVRFAPFSHLVDWIVSLSSDRLVVPSFEHDHLLDGPVAEAGPYSSTVGALFRTEDQTSAEPMGRDNVVSILDYMTQPAKSEDPIYDVAATN